MCNPMYEDLCSFYNDKWGSCSEHTCMIQLLGEEELMRKCKHVGLDKTYPEIYKEIENKIMNKENK